MDTVKEPKYEVECQICGVYFKAYKSTRKYCDKCQHNSKKKQAKLDRYIILSKQATGYYDEPVKKNCSRCHKFIKMVPRSIRSRIMYCSEECRQAALEEDAAKRVANSYAKKQSVVTTSICPACGKEFNNPKKNVYCSIACANKNRIKYGQYTGDITRTCLNCNKQFVFHTDKVVSEALLPKTCSIECRKAYNAMMTSKRAAEARLNQQSIEQRKKLALYEKEGLCGYCKTPYKECERMQSNFSAIPQGARFNNKGKLIKCPKFKDN